MSDDRKSIERRRLERRGGLSVDDPAVHAQTVSDEIDPANLAIWQRAIEMQQHPAKKAMLLEDYNRTINEAKQLAGPAPMRVADAGIGGQFRDEFDRLSRPREAISQGVDKARAFMSDRVSEDSIASALMRLLRGRQQPQNYYPYTGADFKEASDRRFFGDEGYEFLKSRAPLVGQ